MFIDGAWTADDIVGVIEVIAPATEEVIGAVPDAGVKATHAAIAAARRAFDDGPWPRKSPRERAAGLRRFAAILDERHDLLKKLVMAESGSVGCLRRPEARPGWPGTLWSANPWAWWPRSPRSTFRSSSTS